MKLRFQDILKSLTLTAAVVLLPASCCRQHKLRFEEQNPQIRMGVTLAGSKAVISDPDNANRIKQMIRDSYDGTGQKTGGFGVHGFKEVNHVSTKLFDNMRVYPDITIGNLNAKPDLDDIADNTKWEYQPLRYWDRNAAATYQFIAYFPWVPGEADAQDASKPYATSATREQLAQDYDDKELTLHNVPNWQFGGDGAMDFMTTTRRGRYAVDFSTGTVNLSFNHILSQLVIKAYYIGSDKTSSGGVKIKEIILSESATDAGDVLTAGTTDFKQKYYDAKARQVTVATDGNSANIADLGASVRLFADNNVTVGENEISVPFRDEMIDQPNFEPAVIGSWLMVPHKWQNLKIAATFKTGEGDPKTSEGVPVTLGSEVNQYVIQPAKTYIITLLIDTSGGGLEVKTVAVKDWSDNEIPREVYNW